jgi:hypothetical protein
LRRQPPSSGPDRIQVVASRQAFFTSFDGTSLQVAGFIPDRRQQLVPSIKANPARVAGFFVPEEGAKLRDASSSHGVFSGTGRLFILLPFKTDIFGRNKWSIIDECQCQRVTARGARVHVGRAGGSVVSGVGLAVGGLVTTTLLALVARNVKLPLQ